MTWSQGEFTGSGTVDINDLIIMLANYVRLPVRATTCLLRRSPKGTGGVGDRED
jgi:hypothetical protein